VALLPGLTAAAAASVAERLGQDSQPGDLRVVSIHWGGNWGYAIPREHRRFAHRLVDAGVHLVHGHSSHHPRAAEVYRGSLVLYGCGDLVNDYEGIGGYDAFRDDLRLLYLVRLDAATRELAELRMVPFRARRFTLERAALSDAEWLARTLGHAARGLGTTVAVDADGALELRA
jgi:poly-gamma-glutamate synthesis protein (capsule biosynthesis protein)